jgi:hypothetical protein
LADLVFAFLFFRFAAANNICGIRLFVPFAVPVPKRSRDAQV